MSWHARRCAEIRAHGPYLFWIALLLIALQGVHLVARNPEWVIDASWAVYQYHYSLIFFGPAVAAVGSFAGRQLHAANWLLHPLAPRGWLAMAWPYLGAALGAYLVGLIAGLIAVVTFGGANTLNAGTAYNSFTAVAAIAAYFTIGVWLGVRFPNAVIAIFAFLGTFSATLVAWIVGFEGVMRVGGASGGLTALQLDGASMIGRAAWWATLAMLALLATYAILRHNAHVGWRIPLGVSVTLMALAWFVPAPVVANPDTQWACSGSAPAYCVPTAYQKFLPRLAAAYDSQGLAPLLADASGEQDLFIPIDDAGLIREVVSTDAPRSPEALIAMAGQLQTSYAPACDFRGQLPSLAIQAEDASTALSSWLYDHAVPGYSEAPGSERRNSDTEVLAGWLSQLPQCPAP